VEPNGTEWNLRVSATCVCVCVGTLFITCVCVCVQDFYEEQGVFSESFWPQSEPPQQAMAFNLRGRGNKPLTPPPTTQSINNQVGELQGARGVTPSSRLRQLVGWLTL